MSKDRGDTIIELMLAFSIFSFAAVGTIAIMNRGVTMSQQSLEVSLVRTQMDSQAETIRYMRDTSDSGWSDIKANVVDATKIAPLAPTTCPTAADVQAMGGFFMKGVEPQNVTAGNYSEPATYAQTNGGISYGLWAQITNAEGSTPASLIHAYDIYIHACWDTVGGGNVPATLGTIVRIYDK